MSKSNRILQIILFYRFALFSQPQSGHIGRLSTNQKLRQDYFPDSIKDLDGRLYPSSTWPFCLTFAQSKTLSSSFSGSIKD
ncbi:unnamed protein product, partial [Tenebrio molitor]